jgi:hypothetical protein
MTRRYLCFMGSTVLVGILSLKASAQEYSNGGTCASGRKAATLAPVEAYGVHPPGIDPADAQRACDRLRQPYRPYYAPLSPVASTARWKPWSYHPLYPYYTPYYLGYCPHRLFNPPPRRYGSDGWGRGPRPEIPIPEEPGTTPLNFGPYTSVIEDDTTYWNMGGNGLVPYGAPQGVEVRQPDLIDAIQASRPHGRGHAHFTRAVVEEGPAIVSPIEDGSEQQQKEIFVPAPPSSRRTKPAETIPPGEASPAKEDSFPSDRTSRQRTKPAELGPRR